MVNIFDNISNILKKYYISSNYLKVKVLVCYSGQNLFSSMIDCGSTFWSSLEPLDSISISLSYLHVYELCHLKREGDLKMKGIKEKGTTFNSPSQELPKILLSFILLFWFDHVWLNPDLWYEPQAEFKIQCKNILKNDFKFQEVQCFDFLI